MTKHNFSLVFRSVFAGTSDLAPLKMKEKTLGGTMNRSHQHQSLMADIQALGSGFITNRVSVSDTYLGCAGASKQGISPADFDKLRVISEQAQTLLLRYKEMYGSLAGLREHLYELKFGMLACAGYALLCETPMLGQVIEYLYNDLSPRDLQHVKNGFKTGDFEPMLKANSGFLPPFPLEYIRSGGNAAYQFFYDFGRNRAARMILEKIKNEELSVSELHPIIDLLSENDPEKPTAWEIALSGLEDYLIEASFEPYLELRQHIFGTADASVTECSRRLNNVLAQILNGPSFRAEDCSMTENAQIIRSNELYARFSLIMDIKDSIHDVTHYDYNPQDGDSTAGLACSKLLSEFIKDLGLSDVDISALIFMEVEQDRAGEAYGKALANPASGGFRVVELLAPHTHDIKHAVNTKSKFHIPLGLLNAMSDGVLAEVMETDDAKILMHGLKGDRAYLNGIKDRARLDDVLGADLGL
ncbi:hypothetical protein [Pseudomonas amygdali]|uniref:Uncharacterized protein n=2 Tax=Pseudomonas amygdali pv. lachrymans TaxID=53707 RepID=A0AAD0V9N9_PSEAV|nr:hypothetical protein [Pseudomonas amygdali]AXH59829.1 hypothetical protein PLA107_031895 [Pseudomonas amygdali pv. lachrymans str. M301315]RMT06185.1 hypothetical protein ALP54_06402 [Pseudomonas amygdali pv. lachrymans]